MVVAYFVLRKPPAQCWADVGNRATHLWHRTVVFFVFFVSFVSVSFFILPTPPPPAAQCRAGWGSRATHLWHRIVVFLCCFMCRPANPPLPRARGRWRSRSFDYSTHTVAPDCVTFWVLPFVFLPIHSRPARLLAGAWRFSLTFFLSLTDGPPFFPFFLGVPCRLRSLAVQRCGSGF